LVKEDGTSYEYDILLNILSNNDEDELIDLLTTNNNGQFQKTYADVYRDKNTLKLMPKETCLTDKEELLT